MFFGCDSHWRIYPKGKVLPRLSQVVQNFLVTPFFFFKSLGVVLGPLVRRHIIFPFQSVPAEKKKQ